MRTADVLNAAADHIEEVGLHKGAYFKNGPTYNHLAELIEKSKTEATDRPCCILGAIMFAAADFVDHLDAFNAVRELTYPRRPDQWNDMKSRRKGQVVKLLRTAAEREAKVSL